MPKSPPPPTRLPAAGSGCRGSFFGSLPREPQQRVWRRLGSGSGSGSGSGFGFGLEPSPKPRPTPHLHVQLEPLHPLGGEQLLHSRREDLRGRVWLGFGLGFGFGFGFGFGLGLVCEVPATGT